MLGEAIGLPPIVRNRRRRYSDLTTNQVSLACATWGSSRVADPVRAGRPRGLRAILLETTPPSSVDETAPVPSRFSSVRKPSPLTLNVVYLAPLVTTNVTAPALSAMLRLRAIVPATKASPSASTAMPVPASSVLPLRYVA